MHVMKQMSGKFKQKAALAVSGAIIAGGVYGYESLHKPTPVSEAVYVDTSASLFRTANFAGGCAITGVTLEEGNIATVDVSTPSNDAASRVIRFTGKNTTTEKLADATNMTETDQGYTTNIDSSFLRAAGSVAVGISNPNIPDSYVSADPESLMPASDFVDCGTVTANGPAVSAGEASAPAPAATPTE
jgi:hypothetical protein